MRRDMNKQDALKFMMTDSHLHMNEKDAIYCFCMCKMTIIDEAQQSKKYQFLSFVEFLELIGRIAELKFRSTAMNGIPLFQKIEYTLDDIIPYLLPGKERLIPEIQEVEESDSDDDY